MGMDTVRAAYPAPARPIAEQSDSKPGATIEVRGVSKWFGEKVAVSDLSFAIGPGVTALLGPNGAGKSTTLKLLTGQIRPSQGMLRVLGQPVADNPPLYRRIGLVPEQEGVYPFLSALEFVELAARLQRVPKPREAARRALRLVELEDVADRSIGGFSKGMRQRAKIAQALVHDPEVLFLDEPLSGADPRQRLALMETFSLLGSQGKTLLVSSHILNEVEKVASNVLVIVNGKLAAEGDFHAIRGLMEDRPRRVADLLLRSTRPWGRVDPLGRHSQCGDRGRAADGRDGPAVELYRMLPRVAQRAAIRLTGIEGLDDDLESVFRYLVSR